MAALALLAGLIPCRIVCLRGEPTERLVGLTMAGTIDALVLLLAAGYQHHLPRSGARAGAADLRGRAGVRPLRGALGMTPRAVAAVALLVLGVGIELAC